MATSSPARTPGASVDLYWRVGGAALAAVAGLGFLLVAVGRGNMLGDVIAFDTAHNVLHAVLAMVAIALGFGTASVQVLRVAARVAGIVYLALGLVGFVDGGLFGAGDLVGLHLEAGENALHLILGAWGAYAGFRG
jgi:hypothetical protein